MIKVVIFDYGGVMKIGHPINMDIEKIFNVSEEEAKMAKDKAEEISTMTTKGLAEDSKFFEKVSEILGKPLPKGYMDIAYKYYKDSFALFPEMVDLVKKLKLQGIKTAVLSNVTKTASDVTKEKNGYDGFDVVVLSCEVGFRKPELEIYVLTARKLNLSPKECIFIDDKGKNLAPAEELGMKTILFQTPQQAIPAVWDVIKKNS